VDTIASRRSPFVVVVKGSLLGVVLVPCPAVTTSSELLVATPAYSKMANRSVPPSVSLTVTVFAPPAMLSA